MISLIALVQAKNIQDLIKRSNLKHFQDMASTHELDLSNPLWKFSLSLYAIPNNQQLLLSLQDQKGFNINDILLAAFCEVKHISLPLHGICSDQKTWRTHLIEPLREIRRVAKHTEHSAVYCALKNLELKAEQIDIAFLHKHIKKVTNSPLPHPANHMNPLQPYGLRLESNQPSELRLQTC